ncbi:MAG: hypothetical protein J6B34_03965 [Clostridia bacterium]|nr:hypothetical protein [Clostridia bacterium]
MKIKTKNIIKSILFILVALFAIAMIFAYMGYFDRGGSASVFNEANLFDVTKYDIESQENLNGINIDVNRNGQIHIEGKSINSSTEAIKVQSMELKAGTYTITKLGSKTSTNTIYMTMTDSSEGVTAVTTGDVSFTLTSDDTVTFYINVVPGADVDITISPVLVPGTAAGSFFGIGNK